MVWHGAPLSFEAFLEMTIVERFLSNEALNDLIDQSNDRPEEARR